MDGRLHVCSLPGQEMAPGGSVALWGIFRWGTSGPGIRGCYFDMYHLPYILADQVDIVMATEFPDAVVSFRIIHHCHSAKIVQEWFEKHDKELKVLTRPQNSTYVNLLSI